MEISILLKSAAGQYRVFTGINLDSVSYGQYYALSYVPVFVRYGAGVKHLTNTRSASIVKIYGALVK